MPPVNELSFPSSNGKDTIRAWSVRPPNANAVLLVAHGMAEHSDRYLPLAEFLCEKGVALYANDHLGHGRSFSGERRKGYFAKKNGWRALVDDMEKLRALAADENPGLPLFYLGHSMGSFLLRTYLFTYPGNLRGAILSGTGHNPPALAAAGKTIAKTQKLFKGEFHRSKLVGNLCFGPYQKPFKPCKTAFDWLSLDRGNVDTYCADDLCGFTFTLSAYADLFDGLKAIASPRSIARGDKDLPLLFISGARDPVGGMTKGVEKTISLFKKAGYANITKKFYEKVRHEVLNDFCAAEARSDILGWISSLI
jgi:alpha-beta hydrolase superfamily lysophospholipase